VVVAVAGGVWGRVLVVAVPCCDWGRLLVVVVAVDVRGVVVIRPVVAEVEATAAHTATVPTVISVADLLLNRARHMYDPPVRTGKLSRTSSAEFTALE